MTKLNTPWENGPYDARYIFDSNQEVIAYVSNLKQAQLIAAAPDLLEALIDEVKAMRYDGREPSEATLAAIAKAGSVV